MSLGYFPIPTAVQEPFFPLCLQVSFTKMIVHYTAGTLPYVVTGDGSSMIGVWVNQYELYSNISSSFLTSGSPGATGSFVIQPTPLYAVQSTLNPSLWIPYMDPFLYSGPTVGIVEFYLGATGFDNSGNAFTQIGNGSLDVEVWYTIQNYNQGP